MNILPATHAGLQEALGPTYHHACCPAPLRRLWWRYLSSEGREARRVAQQRLLALQEMRIEMASADASKPVEEGNSPKAVTENGIADAAPPGGGLEPSDRVSESSETESQPAEAAVSDRA